MAQLKQTFQAIKEKKNKNEHYIYIACIPIDVVMKMEKKSFPQVYLEEYKYRIKKMEINKFINTKLESESESEPESELELLPKISLFFYFNLHYFFDYKTQCVHQGL